MEHNHDAVRGPSWRFLRDLVLAATLTLLIVFLAELAIRLAGVKFQAELFTSEASRGYTWRPGAAGWSVDEGENYVRINSDGMRDREHSVTKPPHTVRIALLGASEVAAEQVPLDQTFGAVLERHLNNTLLPEGTRVEVLNFGVNGYNQTQIYYTLRDRVWKYQPDLVVFAVSAVTLTRNVRAFYGPFEPNAPFYDIEGGGVAVPDPRTRALRATKPAGPFNALKARIINDSQLLLAFDNLRGAIPGSLQHLKGDLLPHHPTAVSPKPLPIVQRVFDPNAPELRSSWEVVDELLGKMQTNCGEHGAGFWMVLLSTPFSDNPHIEERMALEQKLGVHSLMLADHRLQNIARRRGISFEELSPELADFAASRQTALHGFFNTGFNTGHYNALGNRLVGEMLSRDLLRDSPRLVACEHGRSPDIVR